MKILWIFNLIDNTLEPVQLYGAENINITLKSVQYRWKNCLHSLLEVKDTSGAIHLKDFKKLDRRIKPGILYKENDAVCDYYSYLVSNLEQVESYEIDKSDVFSFIQLFHYRPHSLYSFIKKKQYDIIILPSFVQVLSEEIHGFTVNENSYLEFLSLIENSVHSQFIPSINSYKLENKYVQNQFLYKTLPYKIDNTLQLDLHGIPFVSLDISNAQNKADITNILLTTIQKLYTEINISILEKHKLLFSFLLCLKYLKM